MKAVIRFGILAPWDETELMDDFPSGRPLIYKTRKAADCHVYNHRDGRKVVRVEIREIPKPKRTRKEKA